MTRPAGPAMPPADNISTVNCPLIALACMSVPNQWLEASDTGSDPLPEAM